MRIKIGIGALVLLGILDPSLGIAACCKNYEEFAADCRARGGDPYPNPARCESRGGGVVPGPVEPPSYPNVERRAYGSYHPAEGYRWVSSSNRDDMRVERVPEGTRHERYPNVVWTADGKLRPKEGYRWSNRDNPSEAGYAVVLVSAMEATRIVDRDLREAISRGKTPSFADASDLYQRTRTVAHGLAPYESRCALVLSMTLGLTPRAGEKTLKDVGVIPNVKEAELASRYYVNAKELANRLRELWGQPHEIVGEDAALQLLRGRNGVIYIENGFGILLTSGFGMPLRRGNHIDLWDGTKMSWAAATPGRTSINGDESFATGTTTQQALSRASKIWFWEWVRP